MIDSGQVSVVLQGALPAPASPAWCALADSLARLRRLLPHAPILLGTWRGQAIAGGLDVDQVVRADDPGPLPGFKRQRAPLANNVNRQLAGAAAVLARVATPYTLKLRLDCSIGHGDWLALYARYGRRADGVERIAVPSFFTLDPRMFEQLPFHVSDWCAFGPTASVRRLWSAPWMTAADATHYDHHRAAPHSSWFDRRFRARLAIEQHLACHYASGLGYVTPAYHNDVSAPVLASHDRFMARELLVLDLDQFGLVNAKYPAVARSSLQHLNGLMFLDWYGLQLAHAPRWPPDPALCRALARRQALKRRMRAAGRLADPAMGLLRQPWAKACVSAVLRRALRLNRA